MGVLNITPDSFFDGGRNNSVDKALEQARNMLEAGAAILDVGAVSTRPGAAEVGEEEELSRLLPVVKALVAEFPDCIISVDTYRARVAEEAISAGAAIINDISGGELDPAMFETVARLGVPYVLMHMQGTPQTMQQNPQYTNVATEVLLYLSQKLNVLRGLGVTDIMVDPGFGFGKTTEQNYQLLNNLSDIVMLGYPVLVGVSRKAIINKVLGTSPATALNGTTVVNTLALDRGAAILRVHDVKEAVEAAKIYKFLNINK